MIDKLVWIENNLEVTFSGVCSYGEIQNVNDLVSGDSRFDNMEYHIFDFSAVSKLKLTKKEVKIIGVLDKSASRWNKNVLVALVITNEYVNNLALEYGMIMEGSNWSIHLFSTYSQAKQFCVRSNEE